MFKTSFDKLVERSNKALEIFTKTIEALSKANDEIDNTVVDNNNKIQELKSENTQFLDLRDSNLSIITKINQVLTKENKNEA